MVIIFFQDSWSWREGSKAGGLTVSFWHFSFLPSTLYDPTERAVNMLFFTRSAYSATTLFLFKCVNTKLCFPERKGASKAN